MPYRPTTGKPVTVPHLKAMKEAGEKIAMLTAYDAGFAAVAEAAGVDVLLVGDSLGMVIQGHETTLPVTVADVVYHTRAVARGARRPLLMADMPFMAASGPDKALENAARLMQEGGAQMVKLEGGAAQAAVVERLARQGVPVCAHLGLQPQAVHKLGGYRVQGRGREAATALIEEAVALEGAGADLLLLECVPALLAEEVTRAVAVPVIGIGAGPACDGQVLVLQDVLGVTSGQAPRFARNFLAGHDGIQAAIEAYVQAVREGRFPAPEHCFS